MDALGTTAIALMATVVATSGLGVVFWAVASRLYPPAELGQDAALLSAMMLLSIVSQLNLSMGIPRLLPQVATERWRPVAGAYALTAAVGVAVTLGFVIVAPRVSPGFAVLSDDLALGIALVAAVVLWNVFALQDAVLTSAHWAAVVPVENAIFGVLKIGLMVWLAHSWGHGIFLAWMLAMALMLLPVNGLLFWRVLPSGRRRPHGPAETVLPLTARGRVARYLATDYAAALLSQGYNALLPMLVVTVLGGAANAYFYVAFLIAGAAAALTQALSTSLVVEGAHAEAELASLTRRTVYRYLTFVAPVVAALAVGAPLLLRPFGPEYVTHSAPVLRLLLVATVPQALITLYLGVERVRARVARVLAVEAAIVVLVTAGALVGMRRYGLTGVGLAWLLAQTVVAALVAPRLVAACRLPAADARAGPAGPIGRRAASPLVELPFPALRPSTTVALDAGAALVSAALLVAGGLGLAGAGVVLVGLVFVTFVPGWAVLGPFPISPESVKVALAVVLSLTMCTAGALTLLWLHLWDPVTLLAVSGGLSLCALLWRIAHHDYRAPAALR